MAKTKIPITFEIESCETYHTEIKSITSRYVSKSVSKLNRKLNPLFSFFKEKRHITNVKIETE